MSVFVGMSLEVDELDGDGDYILKPIGDVLLPCLRMRRPEARKFGVQAYSRLKAMFVDAYSGDTIEQVAARAALAVRAALGGERIEQLAARAEGATANDKLQSHS